MSAGSRPYCDHLCPFFSPDAWLTTAGPCLRVSRVPAWISISPSTGPEPTATRLVCLISPTCFLLPLYLVGQDDSPRKKGARNPGPLPLDLQTG